MLRHGSFGGLRLGDTILTGNFPILLETEPALGPLNIETLQGCLQCARCIIRIEPVVIKRVSYNAKQSCNVPRAHLRSVQKVSGNRGNIPCCSLTQLLAKMTRCTFHGVCHCPLQGISARGGYRSINGVTCPAILPKHTGFPMGHADRGDVGHVVSSFVVLNGLFALCTLHFGGMC